MKKETPSERLPARKKQIKRRKKKNGLTPILGVHTKYDLKVMDEIKPPFSKKVQKKLRQSKFVK